VELLVQPAIFGDRRSAIVKFPGSYIAEVHEFIHPQ